MSNQRINKSKNLTKTGESCGCLCRGHILKMNRVGYRQRKDCRQRVSQLRWRLNLISLEVWFIFIYYIKDRVRRIFKRQTWQTKVSWTSAGQSADPAFCSQTAQIWKLIELCLSTTFEKAVSSDPVLCKKDFFFYNPSGVAGAESLVSDSQKTPGNHGGRQKVESRNTTQNGNEGGWFWGGYKLNCN